MLLLKLFWIIIKMIRFGEVTEEEIDIRYKTCYNCDDYIPEKDLCKSSLSIIKKKVHFKKDYGGKCPKGKWI